MRRTIFSILSFVCLFTACQETPTPNVPITDPDNTTVVIVKDICGDGILTGKEVCEGNFFNTSRDCRTYGFDKGDVLCSSTCTLDFSLCAMNTEIIDPGKDKEDPNQEKESTKCGNNFPDDGEDCDTDKPLGLCEQFSADYMDGYVYCSNICKYDFTQCVKKPVCGDGKREGADEQCDTKDSLGHCSYFGDYDTGEVFCSSTCKIDKSQCKKTPVCGNNILEEGEECDDGNKINTDSCTNECKKPKCNDGILSDTEVCDGNLLPYSTCSEYNPNFDTGNITCSSTCTLDVSDCSISPKCGDGEINNTNEQCEVGIPITADCTDIYEQARGSVTCTDCRLDYSQCIEICPRNRTFSDGLYTDVNNPNITVTVKTDEKFGIMYITYKNGDITKIGKITSPKVIRWMTSTEHDTGYYSYFESNCGCVTCDIIIDSDSYPQKELALGDTNHNSSKYNYAYSSNPIPKMVPPETIDFSESSYTQYDYGSKNYPNNIDGCYGDNTCEYSLIDDYYTYLFEIKKKKMRIYADTFSWELTLVEDLGEGLYLMYLNNYFESWTNIPEELFSDGITNPYVVVKVSTSTNSYTVCDWDGVQDINVEIISLSGYRDIAVNYPEYTSNIKLTYKPIITYSEADCDVPRIVHMPDYTETGYSYHTLEIFFTNKNELNRDMYYINGYYLDFRENQCDSFVKNSASTRVGFEANTNFTGYTYYYPVQNPQPGYTNSKIKYRKSWYRSLYRDNVMVLDLDPSWTMRVNLLYPENINYMFTTYNEPKYDRIEIEFSNPEDLNTIFTNYPKAYNKVNNSFSSENISICFLKDSTKECVSLDSYYPKKKDYSTWNNTCFTEYH